MVHACRGAQDGHGRQWRVNGTFRIYQSLSRQAWCCGRGRTCRSAVGRWKSVGKYQARRRSRQKLSDHYEGWQDLQECSVQVRTAGRTIWITDAHRGDGKRFVVHADEKLTAFMELERQVLTVTFYLESISC